MRRRRGEGGVGRKGKGSAQREERRIRFEFAIPCAFSKIREGRRKEGRRFKTRRSIGTSRYRVSPCRRSPYHFPASSLIETRTIDLPSKTEKKKENKKRCLVNTRESRSLEENDRSRVKKFYQIVTVIVVIVVVMMVVVV